MCHFTDMPSCNGHRLRMKVMPEGQLRGLMCDNMNVNAKVSNVFNDALRTWGYVVLKGRPVSEY